MGYATSLFNLMRNIGGSVGIAMTGTMLRAAAADGRRAAGREHHASTTRRRSRCWRR